MAEYDRNHRIPIEDGKRELIAAHHTARVRLLHGQQSAPKPVTALPAFLTADQVIGLIAYDRITALGERAPGEPPFAERWKFDVAGWGGPERRYPLVFEMRWVLARAKWWHRSKRRLANQKSCPLKPLAKRGRMRVRFTIRHWNMPAGAILSLLRADVRQLLTARETHEIAIERAIAILCAEIAAEHITAFGRLGEWRSQRLKSGIHDPIPPAFFANPRNTIQIDGWATCGWDESARQWADWKGPDWGDVCFKRDEVIALLNEISNNERRSQSPIPQATPDDGDSSEGDDWVLNIEEEFAREHVRRHIRQRRITRITERLRWSKEWISFADIAEWCARERGSIKPDENLRSEAYRQLGDALMAGDFGLGRRSRVLFLHPRSNWGKMTQERFGMVRPLGAEGRSAYLQYCWVPSDLAAMWFDQRNLPRPGHLFTTRQPSAGMTGVSVYETPTSDRKKNASGDRSPVVTRSNVRRRPAGANFAESDAPLVAAMRELIVSSQARNRWDAAIAVSGGAKGHGNIESKAKRLVNRYSAAFGPEHDGED